MRKVSAAMPRHKTRHPPPSLRCPIAGAGARPLLSQHLSHARRAAHTVAVPALRRGLVGAAGHDLLQPQDPGSRGRALTRRHAPRRHPDLLDEQWSFAGSKKAEFADSSQRGEASWHKAMARESRRLVEQFVSPRTPGAAELLLPQTSRAQRRDARDAARHHPSRLVGGRGVGLPQRRSGMSPQPNRATANKHQLQIFLTDT